MGFVFKTNIPKVRNKLEEMIALIDGGWQAGIVKIMEEARDKVADLTPRSEGMIQRAERFAPLFSSKYSEAKKGRRARVNRSFRRAVGKEGKHIADGWTLRTIGGNAKSRTPVMGVIYNEMTHRPTGEIKPGAFLTTASGSQRKYTLLHVLEYGSRPHTIRPVNARVLHFYLDDGTEVFTPNPIAHPGTKPYGMVRITRAWLRTAFRRHNEYYRAEINRMWGRR